MYRKTIVGCVCMLIALSGCTRNANLQNEHRVNLNYVLPTESELTHANYGNPINVGEFENAVRSSLKDPYSAKISCTVPEKGWWVGGDDIRHYGYSSICSVNAKNAFGAYTGENVIRYLKSISGNKEFIGQTDLLWHSIK